MVAILLLGTPLHCLGNAIEIKIGDNCPDKIMLVKKFIYYTNNRETQSAQKYANNRPKHQIFRSCGKTKEL